MVGTKVRLQESRELIGPLLGPSWALRGSWTFLELSCSHLGSNLGQEAPLACDIHVVMTNFQALTKRWQFLSEGHPNAVQGTVQSLCTTLEGVSQSCCWPCVSVGHPTAVTGTVQSLSKPVQAVSNRCPSYVQSPHVSVQSPQFRGKILEENWPSQCHFFLRLTIQWLSIA